MKNVSFDPYVPPEKNIPEFTWLATIFGALFGIIFGATTTYLGLKVGLTVGASIPIAVLGISILKRLTNSTILENNIMQTVGSASESIAAGVAFTLPALLFMTTGKEYFHYFQIFALSLVGGTIGVLFMIPLRRVLIVQEHERLPYPEGTACADVLIAGEKSGSLAAKVFAGIGVGFFYKVLMSIFGFWKEIPNYISSKSSVLPNATVAAEITPELLGVGYIIGPRISSVMIAGGVLSNLALVPLITFFGEASSHIIAPGTKLISAMSAKEIWVQYVRYIAAGMLTLCGIVTMIRTFPMIVKSMQSTISSLKQRENKDVDNVKRTDKDLPLSLVIIGSLALVFGISFLPNIPANLTSSILIVVAGFFFVTVSSRIVGLIGTSSNPLSAMTIMTLMATCLVFILRGWTDDIYQPVALCIGAVVAIAAAAAGGISQDLKTGFIVGATPWKQQVGMIIGVVVTTIAVGYTLVLLHNTIGFGEPTDLHPHALPAPQATLMATIIKGLLNQQLPWVLVILGMVIAGMLEICGISSLAFSVGAYLPFSTTMPIFIGGVIKWLVGISSKEKHDAHSELESGTIYSSGLIAGGALAGIAIAIMLGGTYTASDGTSHTYHELFNTGFGETYAYSNILALGIFVILSASLFFIGMKRKEKNMHA